MWHSATVNQNAMQYSLSYNVLQLIMVYNIYLSLREECMYVCTVCMVQTVPYKMNDIKTGFCSLVSFHIEKNLKLK